MPGFHRGQFLGGSQRIAQAEILRPTERAVLFEQFLQLADIRTTPATTARPRPPVTISNGMANTRITNGLRRVFPAPTRAHV